MIKRNAFSIISGLMAILFTIYIAMDTFVISHIYQVVEPAAGISAAETSETTYEDYCETAGKVENQGISIEDAGLSDSEELDTTPDSTPAEITDTSYRDGNIQIVLSTCREADTNIYVADIVLTSSEYLRTAFAKSAYGKNVVDTTSDIADENHAILAINGDYYGVQETGYVIRNGVVYRSSSKGDQEDLVIYKDGSMEIINELDISAEELLEIGAENLLCFGPGLIVDGEISVSEYDEVDKAMTSNPRTAIGVIDDLHYVFVVADGRTSESEGLSLYELAQFMQTLGVTEGYNLDGGGSSTMYFNGNVIAYL